ncbi:MAG: type IX secretion system sortase PorU, partial [Bacteroidetes bacterium]|nr:type IX secretion system sortase PorU [Bacteroidota bacterium]
DKNSNGTFDADDHILFYGQGVNGWTYNATQKRFNHYGNPYSFSNFYFVALGAAAPVRSVSTLTVPGSAPASLTTARGKIVFDEDKYNFNQSGQDWVSAPINAGESRTISTKLTNWVPGTSVTYQYYVYGRAPDRTNMTIEESGVHLATPLFLPVEFADYQYYAYPTAGEATIVPALTDGRSNVKFKYNATSTVTSAYIGWLRMLYTQQLTAISNQLNFASPDSFGTVEYRVNGFSRNDVTVFEVSDIHNVRSMTTTLAMETGTFTFKDTLSTGVIRRYMLCTPDQYRTPKSFVKLPNSDLHAMTGAEFIIITHNEFKSEAQRLKQHKESLPGARKITTVVVDVDTIFNEFGAGIPDPTAMRDFLRYAREHWTTAPKYVLLFGDASYDYRSILQNDRNWVPTYETAESAFKISTFAIEDYFTYIDPAAPYTVSIALGRLTPRSLADAKTVVDKIILYETGMPKGPWKNTVTLVADDMWAPGSEFESEHIYQTEVIAGIAKNEGFNVERLYMEEFETVFASTGRRKPAVRTQILNMVNKQGTLLLNYVGHGNPKVWAHESILTQDDVRNQFVNADKLMFITAATCDWGRFEEAGESSSAEDVVLSRKGGAIGVISANRAVYSNENALLNQRFYQYLFSGDPVLRMGDAYLVMKNSLGFSDNNQKYFLLVDPTISLAAPSGTVAIDSLVNGAGSAVDSIMALERITIHATVRDTANAIAASFNGAAVVEVHDAEFTTTVPAVPGFSYTEKGSIIYSGQATVANGRMSASYVVPKDIAYTNRSGQVSVYFSNANSDGRGRSTGFRVGGTNPSAPADSVGPEITLYFDRPDFRSGDVVTEDPVLFVALKDSNGINSSTHSIGHRLEAWIDGSAKSVDLTEFYQGKVDSYKEGV